MDSRLLKCRYPPFHSSPDVGRLLTVFLRARSWPGPPRSRTSWNYDMSSYEAKRLLNLAEEPGFEHATAMSENKMTVLTETTWKSSNPTNPPSTTISRANSDLSLYMPVRRRSVIQKPGVATRSSSTRDSPVTSRPNFRFSHPPTPSLSRKQSVESYRSGVISMPPRIHGQDVPRVVTPCEDEYQSIGAFKLGSLRITNGAASPVSPQVEKSRKKGDARRGGPGGSDDYFSRTQAEAPAEPPKIVAPQPRAAQLSPFGTSFLSADNAGVSGSVSKDLVSTVPTVPDYLADIRFGTFSLQDPLPVSPKLQTTSKATALDDHLFEDDAQPEYSSVEVLDVRLDPSAKAQNGQADGDPGRRFSRTDSGFASGRSTSESSHKPLTKADSGYSSNVSLRSFQSKAQERELTLSLEKRLSHSSHRASVQSEDRSLSNSSLASHPAPPHREAPPPPVPPKDFPPSPTAAKANVASRKSTSGADRPKESSKTKPAPLPLLSVPSRVAGPRSPESTPRTPASARSARSDRSTSALSIGSGSHKPNKLQRLLSGARRPSNGPLTVHTTHVEDKAGIPAIPRDVEHKLREHTGLFPLTTKRLALKSRTSLDTLKTIFSVGSVDVGSVEAGLEAVNAHHPVPKVPESMLEETDDAKEASWRHTLQAMPSSIAHAASHVVPRKPIARKPVPTRQASLRSRTQETEKSSPDSIVMDEAEIATYSSVNASVGINAYDAALIAMAGQRDGALSPEIVSRTMSLTESAMRHLEMRSPTLTNSPLNLPSPALPSPLLARAPKENQARKSSPPVSMTRRPMSLRVPPPLRPQSSTASLSRKASRESIQSYPSAQPLTRMASRDSIHSYPSAQQAVDSGSDQSDVSPPIPPMDPRRIMAFRNSHPSQYTSPNWDMQTDHDAGRQSSRANSMYGGSRRNSMTSNHGQDGYGIQRPSSAQAWQVRTAGPQLRHRSSYDGYSYPQRHVKYGHAPSMSNGYTAPSKPVYNPWNSNSQFDPGAGQWLQDGRHPPPYVPRGHSRKQSISRAAGANPPFRVLHSYNSPAYRNAPIWG